MILTEAQQAAVVDLASTGRRVSRLHGYAGTGKTSAVATRVIEQLEDFGVTVQVLAPTGKAAKVLRSKGLRDAATIHSYLYTPSKRERAEWREAWDRFEAKLEPGSRAAALAATISEATSESNVDAEWKDLGEAVPKKLTDAAERLRTETRYRLMFSAAGAIAHYEEGGYPANQVLVIDEASMVGEPVAEDLARTGSQLIYIGDPAQLPPVGAPRSRDAMGAPHHLLTEVHRQKGGSDVLKLATRIRKSEHPEARATKPSKLLRLEEYDQVLCWRNATRERVNAEMRRRLRRKHPLIPEPGDRLICLKNTKARTKDEREWMNGEQARVLGTAEAKGQPDKIALHILDDEHVEHEVITPLATFGGHKAEQQYLDRAWRTAEPAFAFGYAITVHKSQGSEWPSVLLIDESADMISIASRRDGRPKAVEQARQWLYTGVTRAQSRLDVVRDLSAV